MAAGGVSGGRPARLTFPVYGESMADILADGKRVGVVIAENVCWRAYLHRTAGSPRGRTGEDEEEVTGKRLKDLRRALRERLAERGPWWSV